MNGKARHRNFRAGAALLTLAALAGSSQLMAQTKASGSLDVGAVLALPKNLESLSKASAASGATAPKSFTALEEDLYRRQIFNGMTPGQAAVWVKSADGRRHIAAHRYFQAHKDCVGFEWGGNTAVQAKVDAMMKGTTPVQTYKCKK
jgi:hypothetical protein